MGEESPKTEHFRTFSNISARQEVFIAAMLSLPTIEAASKAAGVTSKTARLWLKQPDIQQAYQAAKDEAFTDALEALRDGVKDAIDTLKRNMTNDTEEPSPQVRAVQVRSATVWLQNAIQVHKMEELANGLKELKAALEGRQNEQY